MPTPPDSVINAAIAATTRVIRRVEIYESDGVTRWNKDLEVRLIDGSVNIDQARDERRTLDLTLDNSDGVLNTYPGGFWYDKILKPFRGINVNELPRPPKVLIISDPNQQSPTFRAMLAAAGVGTVAVNTQVTTVAELGDYEVIVALGGNDAPVTDLLKQAYTAGMRVFTQGQSASENELPFVNTSRDVSAASVISGQPWGIAPNASVKESLVTGWHAEDYPDDVSAGKLPIALRASALPLSSVAVGQPDDVVLDNGLTENLCQNPSFEYNINDWGSGSNWSIAQDVTIALYGTKSLKCTRLNTTPGNGYTPYEADFQTVNGGTYTASAWVLADATTAGLEYNITVQDRITGDRFNSPGIALGAAGSWTRLSVTFTALGNSMFLLIADDFQPAPQAAQVIHIDGVLVQRSGTVNDYFDGDFVGASWTGTPGASISVMPMSGYTLIAEVNPTNVQGRWVHMQPSLENTVNTVNFLGRAFDWLNPFVPLELWEVQIGEFMIDQISEDNFPHQVKITGRDYTKKCLNSKFEQATEFEPGNSLETLIGAIAANAGVTKMVLPTTGIVVGKTFTYDQGTERWAAIKEMATAYEYDLYFDGQGYLRMTPTQDPSTSSTVITFKTGIDGNLAAYTKTTDDSRLYNHVLVTGDVGDGSTLPPRAEAINTDPNSPTNVDKIGDRLYEYSSTFITTTAQAQSVADSYLAIHSLEQFQLDLSSIVLFWLDVGNIVEFIDPSPAPGDPTRFLLSNMTIPLTLDAMSATALRITIEG